MWVGIISGLLAAFGQSSSYLFSRHFVVRFGSPIHLIIYAQVLMGGMALLIFPWVIDRTTFADTAFVRPLILTALFYLLGQGCFFTAIKEIEASRLSSLLGLKLPVLALINVVFLHLGVNLWQWAAVLLCAAAAMMMNWSGGRITWKAAWWVIVCCICYSLSDIFGRELILVLPGHNLAGRALAGTAMTYLLLGVIALPVLFTVKRSVRAVAAAFPYAVSWFVAMLFLFGCFAAIGTVFGNIVQSTRGIISIVMAVMLGRAGISHLEQHASRKMMWRRVAAAVLMLTAIVLYTLAGNKW
ncbi:MAG: DMT family transporter [Victivallales bacterium]|nr:DMT family transporter [Victivallales bacterium]